MSADALEVLQVALNMVTFVSGLFLLILLLCLPYLIYVKWLTHYGQAVEGTVTNITVEKKKWERYQVSWVDPQTQQPRTSVANYLRAVEVYKDVGDKVAVYVHPTFSRLSRVQVQQFSSLLWKAWKQGELLNYLRQVFLMSLLIGGIGVAVFFLPALADLFTDWKVGLGLLLGGFLIGFVGTWIGGLIIRR